MSSPAKLYEAACKKFPGDHARANAQFMEWLIQEGHVARQPVMASPPPARRDRVGWGS